MTTKTNKPSKIEALKSLREQKAAAQAQKAADAPSIPVEQPKAPETAPAPVAQPASPAPTATENAAPTTKAAKPPKFKLAQSVRIAGAAKRRATQVEKIAKRFAAWTDMPGAEDAQTKIANAVKALREAAALLDAAKYSPGKGTGTSGGSKLAEGQKVNIREKARARYEGAIESEDMLGLTVQKVTEKKGTTLLVCLTKSGDRVVLNRGQVEVVKDEPAPTTPAGDKAAAA